MTEGQQQTEARRQIEFDTKLLPWNDSRRVWERSYLVQLLTITRGNVRQAARFCEKDSKDFYTVMGRNGIDPKDFRR